MQEADAIKKLADSLREKKGVPWSVAKMEMPSGETDYVEFFRGKDFARYFRTNPEKLNAVIAQKAGKCSRQERRMATVLWLVLHYHRIRVCRATGRLGSTSHMLGVPHRLCSKRSLA